LLGGLGIQKLYSSPYTRCLETIRPFTEQHGLDLSLEDHLGERVISKVLLPDFGEVWTRSWEDFDFALPGCETSAVAQSRFCNAIQRIVHRDRGSVLGISSHGNVIALFLNHIHKEYSRSHADKIRNPDVFKVTAGGEGLTWHRDFLLPGLEGISTPHESTPISFSTTGSLV
jgi:2,3-bisphosphoglycerate-dependent phosphoglycerate mutase